MAIENNPNRSNQQKKKKKGSGLWGLILLAVIWAFNRLNSEDVARFFSRLRWMFRTGNFRLDDSFIAVIAAIVLVIVLSVTIVRIKKVRAARRFDGIKATRARPSTGKSSSTASWPPALSTAASTACCSSGGDADRFQVLAFGFSPCFRKIRTKI